MGPKPEYIVGLPQLEEDAIHVDGVPPIVVGNGGQQEAKEEGTFEAEPTFHLGFFLV